MAAPSLTPAVSVQGLFQKVAIVTLCPVENVDLLVKASRAFQDFNCILNLPYILIDEVEDVQDSSLSRSHSPNLVNQPWNTTTSSISLLFASK